MGMTRQERVSLHKKQERLHITKGVPSVMDLDESVPALRKTSEGLVEYIRIGNLLHKKILHEESILGNRISPGINDQAKAIVFTVDNDGAFLSGILGTHGYATRAGTTGSDTSSNAFNFEWDGTYLDGYIDTTEVWPNETSDYRIKENIENIGDGILEKIKALRPIHFTQKEIGIFKQSDKVKPSFIAHELQEQLPNIVKGEKDGIDNAGNVIFQSYNNTQLTTYLVKAVQELSAKVDALEAQIEE